MNGSTSVVTSSTTTTTNGFKSDKVDQNASKPVSSEILTKPVVSSSETLFKPVIFETIEARTELKLLQDQLQDETQLQSIKDLQKFIVQKDENNAWLLDDRVHNLVTEILSQGCQDAKIRVLRILAVCALRDNFINFLNIDRKVRAIMNFALTFENLSLNEQKALAMMFCNLFSRPQTASYALYFSEWSSKSTEELTSNAAIVCNVARTCLSSLNPSLLQFGSAILFNIGLRDVRVVEKPEDGENGLADASLDSEDISLSTLSEKKGQFVALKAYDDMVVDICSSLWEVLTSNKDLENNVINRILVTLGNFIHMLDFASPEMKQELLVLSEKNGLTDGNLKLIQDLMTKIEIS